MSAPDLVIGIDSSTTATKAVAWDAHGRAVAEGRSPLALANPAPFRFEQDPEDWWRALCAALHGLAGQVALDRVAGLAIANQRETVAVLDAAGRALRPAILWLDERCREDVRILRDALGAETILRLIGKMPDPTPALYELHWLRRCEPEIYRRAARFAEVHAYLIHRLTGQWATSWASADPLGVYDLAGKRYAALLLDRLELRPEQFAPAHRPGTVLGEVTAAAAAATGLPCGTPVIAGGGDGQAAGLGVAVLGAGRAYLNLGTAAVAGVYSDAYTTSPAWRTLTSLSGDGYIYELCLRTGTFLTDWLAKGLFDDDYGRLERAAAELPVGAGGLLLQPYWSGSMTPYWDAEARGSIVGLSAEHGRAHLYRAKMEGIALDLAMGFAGIRAAGVAVDEIIAIGGGSRSDLWVQIVADATGTPVRRSPTAEASALGAGVAAAVGLGWFADAAQAAAAMAQATVPGAQPDERRAACYAELRRIYERLYPALRALMAELATFKAAAT